MIRLSLFPELLHLLIATTNAQDVRRTLSIKLNLRALNCGVDQLESRRLGFLPDAGD